MLCLRWPGVTTHRCRAAPLNDKGVWRGDTPRAPRAWAAPPRPLLFGLVLAKRGINGAGGLQGTPLALPRAWASPRDPALRLIEMGTVERFATTNDLKVGSTARFLYFSGQEGAIFGWPPHKKEQL
jgi:hypothetical protein